LGARQEKWVNDAGEFVMAGFIPVCITGNKKSKKLILSSFKTDSILSAGNMSVTKTLKAVNEY